MNKRKVILLLLFIAFNLGTTGLFAQKVSKTFKSEPLKSVLKEVEKQTGFSIIYKTDEVNEKKAITSSFNNASISEVLNNVLDNNLSFSIENKMIVIYKKEKSTPATSSSQKSSKDISGIVVDNQGEPIIGASVKVQGTTNGMTTNFNGEFALKNVPENANLEITYIGMQPQTLSVSGKSAFNITMKDDAKQLEEVVVTAMGIERKAKSLTYATQTINNDDVTRIKDANFINSLQGKSAGLIITPNAGGAGSASKIILRGNSSIEGNNTPLIVVDGIPMSNKVSGQFDSKGGGYKMAYAAATEGGDALSNINPDDIASMTILKGANAAALYGSAAGNGVIIINTKKGREGAIRIDVSSNSLFERPLLLPKLQNTFGAPILNGQLAGRSWGKQIDQQTSAENAITGVSSVAGNDVSKFFNLGTNFNNSISLSGGSEKIQSYFSVANLSAAGMIRNNKFQRNSFTFRQTYNLLSNKLKIDLSANYVNQRTNNRTSGGTVYNPLYNLYLAPRNINMDYYKNNYEAQGTWFANPIKIIPEYTGGIGQVAYWKRDFPLSGNQQVWFQGRGVPAANNPYWLTDRLPTEEILNRIYGTLSVGYTISKNFNLQYRLNYDHTLISGDSKVYATLVDPTGQYIDRGTYGWTDDKRSELFTDLLLSYNQSLSKYFSLSSTIGASLNKSNGEHFWMKNFGASSSPYYTSEDQLPKTINVFFPTASYGTQREYNLFSDWSRAVFATAQLGYKEIAYLDVSYRIDWSRAFSQFKTKDIKDYYGYYSVGANVLLHEAIKMPEVINHLKIRTSYSEVGNSIPNKLYSQQLYDPATGRVQAATYTGFDHPLPETVRSIESGFDLAMFKNKLNLDFTVYNSTMFNQYLPITSSMGSIKPINTGKVRNSGVETTISYLFPITRDFSWRTGFNFSYNENKILKTYMNRPDIYISIGMSDNLRVKFLEGGSYGDMYAKDFSRLKIYDIEKLNEQGITNYKVGDIKLSPDGTPSMNAKGGHSVYLGNMNAKFNLGWNNTISYKNLSFYFLIDGKIGGKVVSFTEAYLDAYGVSQRSADARLTGKTVTLDGKVVPAVVMPDGNLASAEMYYRTIGDQIFPTEYVYDATNFRMREMSIGYVFRNVFGVSKNLSISLIGRNLFFLHKKSPIDPDTSLSTQNGLGGIDIFGMPSSRSFGVNIKTTF